MRYQLPLSELIILADEVMKIKPWKTICEVEKPTETLQIKELKAEILQLKGNDKENEVHTTCYYHRTYGINARKCPAKRLAG